MKKSMLAFIFGLMVVPALYAADQEAERKRNSLQHQSGTAVTQACALCQNAFENRTPLACGHRICTPCISRLTSRFNSGCPLCTMVLAYPASHDGCRHAQDNAIVLRVPENHPDYMRLAGQMWYNSLTPAEQNKDDLEFALPWAACSSAFSQILALAGTHIRNKDARVLFCVLRICSSFINIGVLSHAYLIKRALPWREKIKLTKNFISEYRKPLGALALLGAYNVFSFAKKVR